MSSNEPKHLLVSATAVEVKHHHSTKPFKILEPFSCLSSLLSIHLFSISAVPQQKPTAEPTLFIKKKSICRNIIICFIFCNFISMKFGISSIVLTVSPLQISCITLLLSATTEKTNQLGRFLAIRSRRTPVFNSSAPLLPLTERLVRLL